MLMNALVEKAGDSDIECAGAAGKDIYPELVMETIAHSEKGSTRSLERTPRISIAKDTFSRSLHSPSSREAGLVLG